MAQIDNINVPENCQEWVALAKYKDYNDTEIVPVYKVSYVMRGRDGKVLKFEPYQPKSLDDIDKTGYNYHILTNKGTASKKEERFYAAIARLACKYI